MPHPVYGPPSHKLEQVTLSLWLPSAANGRTTRLEVAGRASTARPALWSYRETWTPADVESSLQPVDTAHWLLLAVAQDQPSSQAAFDRCVQPGGWEDVPLPF